MKKYFCFWFYFLLFIQGGFVFAQTWVNFDTSNSPLPDNFIQKIAEDKDGNIWIATYGGVSKFDGINWVNYNSSNSPLPSDICYALAAQGNVIWIGTVYGLAKFDSGTWTVYTTSNSGIPGDYIIEIEIEDSSSIWIGTWQDGCARFNGNNFTVYNTGNSGLLADIIFSIAFEESTNTVWISTYPFGGVSKYDFSLWETFTPANSDIPSYDVNGIAFDDSNNVWFTSSAGIAKYDGINWIVYDTSNTPMNDHRLIEKPFLDVNFNWWFASNYMGVVMFDGNAWNFYDTTNTPLSTNSIHSLFIDSHNNKWIGTYDGVFVFNDSGVFLNVKNEILTGSNQLILYSNPAKDFINIRSDQAVVSYSIINSAGRLVLESESILIEERMITISLIDLEPGLYVLSLLRKDEKYIRRKIIII